jgi:hypothetical protein
MNYNFLLDNKIFDYGPWIGLVVILGCYSYYLIKSNYTSIPSNNTEALTNTEIGTIVNENMEPISNENIDNLITDNDSDTNVGTESQESQTMVNSDSSSEYESVSSDEDSFIMPDVDFDVCPIEELKLFEFTSLYSTEIQEHDISEEEIMEFLSWFTREELATNWINDVFLFIISLL